MEHASSDYQIRLEPCRKRLRVEFNGAWIADSTRALIMHETRAQPAYYIPLAEWLLRQACKLSSADLLAGGFCQCLQFTVI